MKLNTNFVKGVDSPKIEKASN
uniref:Uncharacterized protein n=1 Tax=Arundo donax TaxID=35708 RepID=A0A0A9U6A7_ARUDO